MARHRVIGTNADSAIASMPLISYDAATQRRYRLLVNGFASGQSYDRLEDAVNDVRATSEAEKSYEIFDSVSRSFIWSKPRASRPVATSMR